MTRTPPHQPITYTRDLDGAQMVEIAPHQFVNASCRVAIKRRTGE